MNNHMHSALQTIEGEDKGEYMCLVLTLVAQNVHTQHMLRKELKLEIISAGTLPTHTQPPTQTHVCMSTSPLHVHVHIQTLCP